VNIIDFHSHIVPRDFPPPPKGVREPSWPEMSPVDSQTVSLSIGGREYRRFNDVFWRADRRIEVLDREGIARQVVSPLPELLSYGLLPQSAYAFTDFMNGLVAAFVAEAPERFIGLGVAALQDVEHAVRQLKGFRMRYGLRGVLVGSNVDGISIAAPRFEPFFAAAEAERLLVFVHGIRPAGVDRLVGSPLLAPVVGVPQETCMAIASLIMTDVLGKFPRLRLVFGHGGGTFGAILDRFEQVWQSFSDLRRQLEISPIDYARRFYYDTVTFGPKYLRYLTERMGVDRLLGGTDGPSDLGQRSLRELVAESGISEAEKALVVGGNAESLFAELA
jgi:aminocarboxymuconate-semialdehyde decarboxylase